MRRAERWKELDLSVAHPRTRPILAPPRAGSSLQAHRDSLTFDPLGPHTLNDLSSVIHSK